MAMSLEEKEVKKQFDTRGKRRTSDLKKNVESINQARDDLLNTTMMQEMKNADAYLEKRYGAQYTSFVPNDPAKKAEEFIKGKDATGKYNVSIDDKLEIIAEHRNNAQIIGGSDKFSADLADTQKIKADAKKRYREAANELIDDYQKLVDENSRLIEKLEKDIIQQKAKIDAEQSRVILGPGENTIMGANGNMKVAKRTEADVNKDEADRSTRVTQLQSELAVLEAALRKAKDNHNLYVREFAVRKNEIEAMLAKAKIFSGAEQQQAEEKSEAADEKDKAITASGEKPNLRAIAKHMLTDFFDRSPEEQEVILAQCGSRDLLNATKHLGAVDRRRLARVLEERLEGMNGSLTFTDRNGNTATVDKDKLYGNAGRGSRKKMRLTKDELRIVNDEISAFYDKLDKKSPLEINEFEDKIKFLRYAAYMKETGWFRNITRRFDAFRRGSTNYQIDELSKRLGRYATLKNEREVNKDNQVDKWRKTLKLNPKSEYSKTNPRELDRGGVDPLLRQDYKQR